MTTLITVFLVLIVLGGLMWLIDHRSTVALRKHADIALIKLSEAAQSRYGITLYEARELYRIIEKAIRYGALERDHLVAVRSMVIESVRRHIAALRAMNWANCRRDPPSCKWEDTTIGCSLKYQKVGLLALRDSWMLSDAAWRRNHATSGSAVPNTEDKSRKRSRLLELPD